MSVSSYLAWTRLDEYGRPIRWSKAHVTQGGQMPLCGAHVPANAEMGDEHDADGYCRRCDRIAKARGLR